MKYYSFVTGRTYANKGLRAAAEARHRQKLTQQKITRLDGLLDEYDEKKFTRFIQTVKNLSFGGTCSRVVVQMCLILVLSLFSRENIFSQKSFSYSTESSAASSYTPSVEDAIDLQLENNATGDVVNVRLWQSKSGSYYFLRTSSKSGKEYKSYVGKFHDVDNGVPRFKSKAGNINAVVLNKKGKPTVRTLVKAEPKEDIE